MEIIQLNIEHTIKYLAVDVHNDIYIYVSEM